MPGVATWGRRIAIAATTLIGAGYLVAAAFATWVYSAFSSAAIYVPWDTVVPLLIEAGASLAIGVGLLRSSRLAHVSAIAVHLVLMAHWATLLMAADLPPPLLLAAFPALNVVALIGLAGAWPCYWRRTPPAPMTRNPSEEV
jgi:hypothetical protein